LRARSAENGSDLLRMRVRVNGKDATPARPSALGRLPDRPRRHPRSPLHQGAVRLGVGESQGVERATNPGLSDRRGNRRPPKGSVSPHWGDAGPDRGSGCPLWGVAGPDQGRGCPHRGSGSPHWGGSCPPRGRPGPQGGRRRPPEGKAGPRRGSRRPVGGQERGAQRSDCGRNGEGPKRDRRRCGFIVRRSGDDRPALRGLGDLFARQPRVHTRGCSNPALRAVRSCCHRGVREPVIPARGTQRDARVTGGSLASRRRSTPAR
jgi:hypothetical protein